MLPTAMSKWRDKMWNFAVLPSWCQNLGKLINFSCCWEIFQFCLLVGVEVFWESGCEPWRCFVKEAIKNFSRIYKKNLLLLSNVIKKFLVLLSRSHWNQKHISIFLNQTPTTFSSISEHVCFWYGSKTNVKKEWENLIFYREEIRKEKEGKVKRKLESLTWPPTIVGVWHQQRECRRYSVIYHCGACDWKKEISMLEWKRENCDDTRTILFICIFSFLEMEKMKKFSLFAIFPLTAYYVNDTWE
jgi:hypothetical protein